MRLERRSCAVGEDDTKFAVGDLPVFVAVCSDPRPASICTKIWELDFVLKTDNEIAIVSKQDFPRGNRYTCHCIGSFLCFHIKRVAGEGRLHLFGRNGVHCSASLWRQPAGTIALQSNPALRQADSAALTRSLRGPA